MMDAIWNALNQTEHHSWKPSAAMERLRATYDWSAWIKEACSEAEALNKVAGRNVDTAPLREFSHFALTTGNKACSDNKRPHKFVFEVAGQGEHAHVVMTYYHWCHSDNTWPGEYLGVNT